MNIRICDADEVRKIIKERDALKAKLERIRAKLSELSKFDLISKVHEEELLEIIHEEAE